MTFYAFFLGVKQMNEENEDAGLEAIAIVFIVLAVLAYVSINIAGTIYFTRLPQPTNTEWNTSGLYGWNLASVILGWLLFPLLNLSSIITFKMHHVKLNAA